MNVIVQQQSDTLNNKWTERADIIFYQKNLSISSEANWVLNLHEAIFLKFESVLSSLGDE